MTGNSPAIIDATDYTDYVHYAAEIDYVDYTDYADYADYGAATDYVDYATATKGDASKRTSCEKIAPSHGRVRSIPPSTERRRVGEQKETVVINVINCFY